MELELSDLMMMSMMRIKEAVAGDAMERILGKSIMGGSEKTAKKLKKNDFAGYEQVLLEDTIENLYGLIITRPEVFATALSLKNLKAPDSVKGYFQNMQKIYLDLLRFEKNVKTAVDNNLEDSYILFREKEVRDSFDKFMIFMKNVYPFFEIALKADKISKRTDGMSEEFFEYVPQLNAQLRKILEESSELVGDWDVPGILFKDKYNIIMEHLDENSKYVDSQKAMFEQIQAQKRKIEESKIQTVKVPELSQEELERRRCIQEANMMYDELVRNTMRDLEKQVPYSAREMYDYFVNVKFAKFVKNFSMPLESSTRLNIAREVCSQLNELNNYISRISENATTTNVYMMKE